MSNQITTLAKLIQVGGGGYPVPNNLRIFLVWKNGYTYANKGHMQESHSVGTLFSHLRRDRGEILNAFSKLEFLLMELVRIKTMGEKFSYNSNLIDLIAKPNVSIYYNYYKNGIPSQKPNKVNVPNYLV